MNSPSGNFIILYVCSYLSFRKWWWLFVQLTCLNLFDGNPYQAFTFSQQFLVSVAKCESHCSVVRVNLLSEFFALFLHEVLAQSRLDTCSLNSLCCFCVKFLPSPDHILAEFSALFLHEVFAQSRSDCMGVIVDTCVLVYTFRVWSLCVTVDTCVLVYTCREWSLCIRVDTCVLVYTCREWSLCVRVDTCVLVYTSRVWSLCVRVDTCVLVYTFRVWSLCVRVDTCMRVYTCREWSLCVRVDTCMLVYLYLQGVESVR